MIRLRVRGLRGELMPFELGPTAVLSAREAREMEGDRDRSRGVRLADITLEGRDEPPSLTPPPRTVTLPPSYGVTVGVVEVIVDGVMVSREIGVFGEGVRPRDLICRLFLSSSLL